MCFYDYEKHKYTQLLHLQEVGFREQIYDRIVMCDSPLKKWAQIVHI